MAQNLASFDSDWRKNAILFLVSQNLSLFGSSTVGFALVWWIALETASGLWLTVATLACNVPQILLLFWGGVLADRYNRRSLIILSDGFVALVTLGLTALYLRGLDSLWLLIGVLALRSLGGGIQAPAVDAIYPQIVPPTCLSRVQGINQTINAGVTLFSPAVGGFLLGTVSLAWVMMIDVVTALSAIIVMWRIKVPTPLKATGNSSAIKEIREGLLYVAHHPQLKALILSYGAFFFLVAPAAVLSPLMIARSFGGEVWRLTAMEIAWSGMSILGGLLVAWLNGFSNKCRTIAHGIALFGLIVCFMGVTGNFLIFLALMGSAGFIMPIITATVTVFLQEESDERVLGRVFSIQRIITSSALPGAILIFGPLAEIVSVEILFITTGFFMVGLGYLYRVAVHRQSLKIGDESRKNHF
ncbi:MAG: MFS transporter [Deltaproteobacteria bacterium]|jgi:DHA3 family macrolide efflux protein-like MFS transporter|nr:MFS transporter [Deltaproteobacteria bacterium]